MNSFIKIFNNVWVSGLNLSRKKMHRGAYIRPHQYPFGKFVEMVRAAFPDTKPLSTVRRTERLLSLKIFSVPPISRAIVKALPAQKKYILTMDRTTWELGTRVYNILAVGICWDGISVPI